MIGWQKHFLRKTQNGHYFAFVDGLRFVAILSVVFFHIPVLKIVSVEIDESFLYKLIPPLHNTGGRGVHVFFVLSAFILSVNELKRTAVVPLATFYKRRLWRIYPPFFLAIAIIFVANVWITHQYTLRELFPSFLATATYIQNVLSYYYSFPELSAVTWTLELEIQFYLLFPFLKHIYTLSPVVRRAVVILGIGLFVLLPFFLPLPFISIYDNFSLFLLGMLLGDLYVNAKPLKFSSILNLPLALLSFFFLFYTNPSNHSSLLYEIAFVTALFAFFYSSYQEGAFNKFLSSSLVCIIGGMCYSVYLLHTPILSLLEKGREKWLQSEMKGLETVTWCWINVLVVLSISAAYFLLIEKTFMGKKKVI